MYQEAALDDPFIDRLTRLLGATPNRRITLGLAASIAFGILTGLLERDEAEAGKKKKGGKKKGKKPKNSGNQPPEGDFCGDRFCRPDQRCCGGECVDPSLCCTSNSDCNACSHCYLGQCVPDPAKNGTACAGCQECVNGACGVPNDAFCREDEICRHSTGLCCRKCQNGQCCPVGAICINPGVLSPNFCCNAELNQPCGDNGDGTFRECCSNANEECVNDTCVPKGECRSGGLSTESVCCPFGPPCNGGCCGENEICGADGVCENPFVCPRAFCSNRDLVCCPPNRFTSSAYCCPQGSFCRDTVVGCSSL